jgi:hypothetical protein
MISRAGTSARATAVALLSLLTLAAPAAASAGPSAGARLLACHRSPAIEQRTAVVGTWMRPLVNDGRRLAVKLDLWQRTPDRGWTLRTDVPVLGAWVAPSDPLVGTRPGDLFKYRQAVGRLEVPAAYRFRVTFRWSNAAGAVVRQASVTTRACRQPDLRPDLVLDAVSAAPSPRSHGLVRYEVTVRNAGRSAAPRSEVAATLPGDTTPNQRLRTVAALAPGASAVVAFTGPGCAAGGTPASFVADPANALEEADEANDELAAACPAP